MTCIPSQPHKSCPSWGEAYGLLSFQVTGVLIASLFSYVTTVNSGILINVLTTMLFSALYVQFVEARVPGALSKRRYRVWLSVRASVLLSLLGIGASLLYEGRRFMEDGGTDEMFALIFVGVLISFVSVLTGLETGSRYARWKQSRAAHQEKV